jgi:hypothetical protein
MKRKSLVNIILTYFQEACYDIQGDAQQNGIVTSEYCTVAIFVSRLGYCPVSTARFVFFFKLIGREHACRS